MLESSVVNESKFLWATEIWKKERRVAVGRNKKDFNILFSG